MTLDDLSPLERAIVLVESGGKLDAIGDKHLVNKAYGPMQIRKPCVDDVNRIYDQDYTPEDCLNDLELSVKIFRAYTKYWTDRIPAQRQKVPVSDKDRALVWHLGPAGWRTDNPRRVRLGEIYWSKVSRELEKINAQDHGNAQKSTPVALEEQRGPEEARAHDQGLRSVPGPSGAGTVDDR